MNIRKFLAAAATATVLSAGAVSTASADSWHDHGGYGYHDRDFGRRDFGRRDFGERRFVDRHRVFETLRFHRIRYMGEPYFVRGHYVVRTFDRFGRIAFIEINPYTGALIGYLRI